MAEVLPGTTLFWIGVTIVAYVVVLRAAQRVYAST
jgi:hypothetical protein